MIWKLAARDLAFVVATLAVWRLDAAVRDGDGVLPLAAGVTAGALATVAGYLAHEWGHLPAALASGSVVHLPERVASVFLFHYDVSRNGRRQFLVMSCGGFVASALVIALFLVALPLDALAGRVTLGLTLLGVAATLILEIPPAWRVYRGGPLPTGVAYRSS
jgi:hypothetical protein